MHSKLEEFEEFVTSFLGMIEIWTKVELFLILATIHVGMRVNL